jgi:hypothetical protein
LKTDSINIVSELLLLTLYWSSIGICIFQKWAVGFDPNADRDFATKEGTVNGMRIPTWVTLRNVPDEFRGVLHQIATGIGEVLGTDPTVSELADPRFCLGLESGRGWEPSVIIIDYNSLPI